MKVVLDTNCFIDAVNKTSRAYEAVQVILKASRSAKVALFIGLHSLHELEQMPDDALTLAKSLPLLPHFPVGTWEEQLGVWNQAAGTWEDAKRNEGIQNDLKKRAKSGADIRDRGAYIDALHAHADVFVTSDKDLAGNGPSSRIVEKYELKIMTPLERGGSGNSDNVISGSLASPTSPRGGQRKERGNETDETESRSSL